MSKLDPFDNVDTSTPLPLLLRWFQESQKQSEPYNDAAQLATVDTTGMPNIRTVLIKSISADGLIFYTNMNSTKGKELTQTPRAALLFYWRSTGRQIRLRGNCIAIDEMTADRYFATRPRCSQIGAHASKQSQTLKSREIFEADIAEVTSRFHNLKVPRPHYWSGFQLTPISVEFWQEGEYRLHDRLLYEINASKWQARRLYP